MSERATYFRPEGLPGVEADYVGSANHQAMFDATSHVIAQGHRRIAYITTPEPINTVQDRLQGYMRAMRESKLEFEAVLTTLDLRRPPNGTGHG